MEFIHSFLGSEYLITLFNKINELPTRNDIKGLLQKCVYSILIDENVEEEIQFLREMKNLLDRIRLAYNPDHVEIINVINEIYRMAVDKKIDEEILVEKENKIVIEDEVLGLFEATNGAFDDSREMDEEEQEAEEDQEEEEEDDDVGDEEDEAGGEGTGEEIQWLQGEEDELDQEVEQAQTNQENEMP